MDRRLFLSSLAITSTALPASARHRDPVSSNPQIDFAGFQRLTGEVASLRERRLLPFADFKRIASMPGVLLLDARSDTAFREGHINRAVNLPLPDFNAESLAHAIGPDTDRRILIYCNNNFLNQTAPVPIKARPLALNISTFINLVGYGYPNVWELADVIDFNDPGVEWVRAG